MQLSNYSNRFVAWLNITFPEDLQRFSGQLIMQGSLLLNAE